jgi:TolB-like protein/Flp pilus assembly protein TadD
MSLVAELQRRNVIRMTVAYLVFAWVVMQVLSVVGPVLDLPPWGPRLVLVLLAVGFVGVVVFSWIYELTPEGLKRESEIDRTQSITAHTARKLDIAVIVLLAIAIGLFVFDRYAPRPEAPAPTAATTTAPAPEAAPAADASGSRSIAVLPFVNMSSDPEQTYFSDGIAEELLNALVKLPGLKVAGRTSSFAFRDKAHDLRAIGKALDVNHILEGSVRKQGTRIRITAQLVKAEDGFHLWSETYERDVSDIFALQDEITARIVDALQVTLGQAPAPTPTASAEAYALYLRARQQLALRGVESLGRARTLFQESIAIDPKYAPAHAGLARAAALRWSYGQGYGLASGVAAQGAREAVLREVHEAAQAALALDPANAEAWSELGHLAMTVEGDWSGAARAHERALLLSPNDPEVVNFAGDYLNWVGDPRALDTERRAVALDPMQAANHHDLALVLVRRGDHAAALESAAEAQALGFYERAPELAGDTLLPAYIGLGRFDEARALMARIESNPRASRVVVLSGHIWIAVAAGDTKSSGALLAELRELAQAGKAHPSSVAANLLRAGLPAEAAPWLERALASGDFWFADPLVCLVPERLPAEPALQAALDHPLLNPLFEIRRRHLGLPP